MDSSLQRMETSLHQIAMFADFLSPSSSSASANASTTDQNASVEVVQTHLSYVCLLNDYAFKIKKAVNLGPPFVNQCLLSERERLCVEEVKKNREWNTNDLYLGVFPVCRLKDSSLKIVRNRHPVEDLDGTIVDWAIWMRRFPSDMRLDKVLARQGVNDQMIQEFGTRLAQLQQRARRIIVSGVEKKDEKAQSRQDVKTSEESNIARIILENLSQLLATDMAKKDSELISTIQTWFQARLQNHREVLLERERTGFVRELHADLHSGNLMVSNGVIEMFDCLEFNDELARIDMANDIAFLFMDLLYRNHERLAWLFVDAWLQETGDFEAVQILTLFAAYRAVVRCKIAALQGPESSNEYTGYLNLCHRFTKRGKGAVVAMVGKSGSGKSFWGKQLVPALGGFQVRSDIERKRLFNQLQQHEQRETEEEEKSSVEEKRAHASETKRMKRDRTVQLYSDEMTQMTYERLNHIVQDALLGKVTVIVDATFLGHRRRHDLVECVRKMNAINRRNPSSSEHPLPVFIHCTADMEVMHARIAARAHEGKDASDADRKILDTQVLDPFTEEDLVIPLRTDGLEAEKDLLLGELCTKIRHAVELDGLS